MSKPALKVPEPDLSSLPALSGDPVAYFRENGRLWREAREKLEMPAEAHPEPLVGARPAREVEIPSAARGVRRLAEASGWTVRATYALGWVLGSRGETRALTHSLALRMRCDFAVQWETRWVVAVWSVKEPHEGLLKLADRGVCEVPVPVAGWKFDLGYGWGGGQPHHKLSAVALKTTIKGAQS